MASMRYVRDGGNRPQTYNRSATSRAPTGRGGGGRFSARGRGRGRFASHAFVRTSQRENNNANKWVRNTGDRAADEAGMVSHEMNLVGVSENESAEPVESIHDGGTNLANSEQLAEAEGEVSASNNFERRGKHKLVLKKDENSNGESDVNNRPLSCDQNMSTDEQNDSALKAATDDEKNDELVTSAPLERCGKNKLVLKKDETVNVKEAEENVMRGARETAVSAHAKSSLTWSRQPKQQLDQGHQIVDGRENRKRFNYDANTDSVRTKKRSKTHYNGASNGSRRICLGTNTQAIAPSSDLPNEECKQETEQNSNTVSENATTVPSKKLTDFAYRDSGRGRGNAKRGHPRTANIGLVRVKPENPSATAICPTFRRGLPCNNPKCTLRHDVSSEASRPICVFFQRNGMCSKGDACIFRHVKVRWDAEVCPMFEKLGYCENSDCVLRHVVAKKPKDGKDNAKPGH